MEQILKVDYTNTDNILARLKDVFEIVQKKSKSDVDVGDLQRACGVLIGKIGTNPKFLARKLLMGESVVRENSPEVSSEELEEWYAWIDLSNDAYEMDTRTLESKLQERNYFLIRHHIIVKTGDVGYFLAFCPERKELLIGIKGTSSMEDAITDCLAITIPHQCTPLDPFTGSETGREVQAHEGILASAIQVCDDVVPLIEHCYIPLGYKVNIVGHSLGAGTGALLAVLLRARFPDLQKGRVHAYCIAPPPVLDIASAEAAQEFVSSLVNRSDCVPRASMGNVEVLVRTLEGLNGFMEEEGLNDFWALAKETMFGEVQFEEEHFDHLVQILQKAQAAVEVDDPTHLYVPGKIVALYAALDELPKEGEEMKELVKAAHIAPSHTWIRLIDLVDTMIDDHFIDGYKKNLSQCLQKPA